ncbi:MAG: hypothetical protein QUS14_08710 [Pyrinomonadaceae bacterium]|nr:hypothetical protein [Pyrinomonadaceae bacterium]
MSAELRCRVNAGCKAIFGPSETPMNDRAMTNRSNSLLKHHRSS